MGRATAVRSERRWFVLGAWNSGKEDVLLGERERGTILDYDIGRRQAAPVAVQDESCRCVLVEGGAAPERRRASGSRGANIPSRCVVTGVVRNGRLPARIECVRAGRRRGQTRGGRRRTGREGRRLNIAVDELERTGSRERWTGRDRRAHIGIR